MHFYQGHQTYKLSSHCYTKGGDKVKITISEIKSPNLINIFFLEGDKDQKDKGQNVAYSLPSAHLLYFPQLATIFICLGALLPML